MDETQVVGIITARGGSKGVPRKNVRMVAGKPLIAWTIEAARQARSLNRVIVSTDDAEIARVAQHFGAEIPFIRPASLAQDNSTHIDVLCHAIHWLRDEGGCRVDYVVNLQPTSPMRLAEDIDGAVTLAIERRADAVVSICPTSANPHLVKQLSPTGELIGFAGVEVRHSRRQELPPAYVFNGSVYVNRADHLLATRNMFAPGMLGYVMPESRSWDIDTEEDLQVVDFLMTSRLNQRRAA